jgi:hypothetical protein
MAPQKLTIAFQGLMLFQSTLESKHVAIVDARDTHHHDPKIEIWRGANPKGIPETISLSKDDVVELDVASGTITRDELYRAHVPELRDFITSGEVDTRVVQRVTKKDGVLAYFALPPGALTTLGTFDEPVRLTRANGDETTLCFARFVVLQTEIASDVKMTVTRVLPPASICTYTIAAADLLLISNISPHPTGDPHFTAAHGRRQIGACRYRQQPRSLSYE